ncbi:MAG: LysR substrate-binding domain-containing protein [Planctomycetota bacterium]
MITLRQLEIFLAVARAEHVTAAAEQLHLSQSAVSAALAELSEQLGGPLFDRSGRRIVRNARGTRLLEEAADLLQRASDLVRGFRGDREVRGRLRVGASSTIGMYLLPERVARFAAANDGVDVDLEIGNSAQIEDRLVARSLDVGFVEGPPQRPELDAVLWRVDELAIFVRAGDPLARRRGLGVADLAAARWVSREAGSGTRAVFEAAMRDRGLPWAPAVTMGHSEAVKAAVHAGLGVGCLSTLAIRSELQSGAFVRLRVVGIDLTRRLWLLRRRQGYASALQRAFEAFCAAPERATRGRRGAEDGPRRSRSRRRSKTIDLRPNHPDV